MPNSTLYNFFFVDISRALIIIFIIIGTILFLAVLGITLSLRKKNKNKFKLVYIIMINVMITAILEPISYLLNWVNTERNLLFGNQDGFFCQAQAFSLTFFQSSREIFVTLISIITFISFKFSDVINIDESNISLILVFLFGYLIPFIESMIYLLKKGFGRSHCYCFTKIEGSPEEKEFSELIGTIHFSFVVALIIVSIFFISYLIIATTNFCNKVQEEDLWIKKYDKKYCINPKLKKIIYFPIAQVITMSLPVIYRFKSFISHNQTGADDIAGPAAVVNSVSTILYTSVFAISNEIFTNFSHKMEKENLDVLDGLIELGNQ